jgi:tetratricopeptide (TPR) repeat protein
MRLCAAVTVLVWCALAAADARQDEAARQAFQTGRVAYENGDYQTAYDRFKESFQLSHEPALLYNISSALQGLKRPHEAAESLRSFLRLQPNDPDRPKIEQRIATLEEEQRMIDADARKQAEAAEAARRRQAPVLTPPPPPETHAVVVAPPAPAPTAAERRHRNKVLAISLTVGAVVLAGAALAIALPLTLSSTQPFTTTSLGPHPGTR